MSKQTKPLVNLKNIKKYYDVSSGLFNKEKRVVKAIDGVSLTINEGEILGLAGESGSGKTTVGEVLVRLQDQTDGEIIIDDISYSSDDRLGRAAEKEFRKDVQMIFQEDR